MLVQASRTLIGNRRGDLVGVEDDTPTGGFVAAEALAGVEARTQELGGLLHRRAEAYARPPTERLQDYLMVLLMKDPVARTRLLRLVDVLASLPPSIQPGEVASLVREYLRMDASGAPLALRLASALGALPLVPPPLLAWLARTGTRFMAGRFIVAPDSGAAERTLQQLGQLSRYPSFDLLGEAVLSEDEARQYRQGYLALLTRLGAHPLAHRRTAGGSLCLEVSIKLTGLTSQFNPMDPQGTLRRVQLALEEVFAAAAGNGIGVTVDAEQYAYRDLTWRIVRESLKPGGAFGAWPDAGIVVQAYLRDVGQHVREVVNFIERRGAPLRIRLVKGAYWDQEVIVAEQNGWPVPVFRDKNATDRAYEEAVRSILQDAPAVRLAVASHNIRAHANAEAVREALGLGEGRVEHQTLHHTMEGLSRALAGMGWVTRDYIPVGELIPGMAYLVRRILENTSQVGFLIRSRLHENVGQLLRPPEPSPEDTAYHRPAHASGFANTPTARLFEAQERAGFEAALASSRGLWATTYPVVLGEERVHTPSVRATTSPSYPDARLPVGWVYRAGTPEVERAIALANGAAPSWAARSLGNRAEVGLRAAQLLTKRKMEVAAWVVHEGGRTWSEALADVEEGIDQLEWNARQLLRLGPRAERDYRPRGVVACIPPWNFPVALPAGMVSAALMAGNAVILKSAEHTPIVAQLLAGVFHEAGVPQEALVHLAGPGSVIGAVLVESPDVDMVAFTGSKEVGVQLYEAAARVRLRKGGIKRVIAEMGGKNAIVVFPDADMDEAVAGILSSAFSHSGQKCSACSRVLVHRSLHARLRQRLIAAVRSLPMGPADDPGTVLNPLISSGARARVAGYAEVARSEGEVLLDLTAHGSGNTMGPLLVEVGPDRVLDSRIGQEEVFGPILTLTPFDTEDEAVRIVNGTPYAQTLGIFSRSPRTIARMVRACNAGNIYVNRGITGARVGIEPFGGFLLSGTGPKAGGEEYLLAFLARRDGFRAAASPDAATPISAAGTQATASAVGGWDWVGVSDRLECLERAARLLEAHRSSLAEMAGRWKQAGADQAREETNRVLETVRVVLRAASQIAEPQQTVSIPGQRNYIAWDHPRGVGLVAADNGAAPEAVAGLLVGPLLAGNGLVVAAPPSARDFVQLLVSALHSGGVPRESLVLAPADAALEQLAAGPVQFAAVDLALGETQRLYQALAVTREAEGQRWLKALVSAADGQRPGEPEFLRQFCVPKSVAVQTLRHGADLELG